MLDLTSAGLNDYDLQPW